MPVVLVLSRSPPFIHIQINPDAHVPAQKTITTRNRTTDCSLLPWQERKTPPIGQWREEVEEIGIRHAMKKMSLKVAFSKLMNARQVECISFELVEVDSVNDLIMGSILQ